MIFIKQLILTAAGCETKNGIHIATNSHNKFIGVRGCFWGETKIERSSFLPLYVENDYLMPVEDVSATNAGDGYIKLMLSLAKNIHKDNKLLVFIPHFPLSPTHPRTNGKVLFTRHPGEGIILLNEGERLEVSNKTKTYTFKNKDCNLVEIVENSD